jgi:TonB-linked SusC/RagA family outer membrane protein
VQVTFAQEKTVSGTVSDDSGPLPGVSILIKGTASGSETDFDGKYSIRTKVGDVLVFQYLGYRKEERTVGESNTIDLTLSEDASVLDEVVVTALGLKREAKSIGYGIDVVKGESLTQARESNIVNSLQGKVTGVQITNTGGNLGGSSKVVIRGVSSLSGRNNPLWIVDGVMINDSQTSSLTDGDRITGNRDFSNGASLINPDDVESISVLKGAAATALYGSRAAAGAIIVTTKRGKKGDGARVTVNSSVRFDDLFVVPDYQQVYGSGDDGVYDPFAGGTDWGPRIVGQTLPNLPVTGETGPLRAVKDNGIRDFYDTGVSYINNFAISDATEKMDYRLSLTSLNQDGILPGASLDRFTVSLNAGVRHNEKLESRFSVQYIQNKTVGTGVTGTNDPNVINLDAFSSTLDQNLFSEWKDASGNQINTISGNDGNPSNNPLWLRFENSNDREEDRVFGNYEITFKPIENLSVLGRVGMDMNDDRRFIENSKGTINRLDGNFNSDNIRRKELTVDLIANYFTDLTEDLSLNVIGGYQYNSRLFERQQIFGNNLLIPELFSPGNVEQTIGERDFAESRVFGFYTNIELSYRDYLTLTLTGRNDFTSTLPEDNNSYFYPSASVAFVFSDAFNLQNDWFTYGKFRGSYANVGNDTGAYQLDFLFNPITTATGQYSLDQTFPFNGALAYSASATIPPTNLQPEDQQSIEFGLELKFLKGRLGLDFAYFKNENINQIARVPIPESTGFGFNRRNIGQINQEGIELAIEATPIIAGDFRWDTNINFSTANVTVESLTSGLARTQLPRASGFSSVSVQAVEGGTFELYGIPFLRNEAGQILIDEATGRRQAGEVDSFGSVLPDWNGGWVNNFSYKGFRLSATIDARWGGVIKSSTVEDLQQSGKVSETLVGREGTFIDTAGVIDNGDGTFRANDVPLINAQDFWINSLGAGNASEAFVFDASFIKLREVALTYSFPSEVIKNTFLKGLSVGVEGRNLALLYSKVPHIDPEANLFGSATDGFGVERSSIPSTRSVGFNVRLTF